MFVNSAAIKIWAFPPGRALHCKSSQTLPVFKMKEPAKRGLFRAFRFNP